MNQKTNKIEENCKLKQDDKNLKNKSSNKKESTDLLEKDKKDINAEKTEKKSEIQTKEKGKDSLQMINKIIEEDNKSSKGLKNKIDLDTKKIKLINLEAGESPNKSNKDKEDDILEINSKQNDSLNYLIKEKEFNPKNYFNNLKIDEEDLEEQNCFEVEKVLGHRFNFEKKLYYFVKWKGWPAMFNSWEPEENFAKNRIVLMEYIDKIGGDKADYQNYLETLLEFDNLNNKKTSKNKDISNFVYVLDKSEYLATAENFLKNEFYMPTQIIRSAQPSNPIVMGCKNKKNMITIAGSALNQNLQDLNSSPSKIQKSKSSGLNSESMTSLVDKTVDEKSIMPKFFNNMCEPEKNAQIIDDNNILVSSEAPVRSKFYKLLKNNIGLDLKKRICEREEAKDPALFGSFRYGDVPLRILKIEVVSVLPKEVQLNCLIEWVHRKNGFKPKNSVYSNHILKQKSPLLLINFYESNIHIF